MRDGMVGRVPGALLRLFVTTIFALAAGVFFSTTANAQSIAAGTNLWAAFNAITNPTGKGCAGCHGTPADLPQMNAANAVTVLDSAIANNAGFSMATFSALTAIERSSLALYIGSTTTQAQSTSVNFGASVSISLGNVRTTSSGLVPASAVITGLSTASAPTRGTLSAYNNVTASVTYTHTASNCTVDSFQFRGSGLSSAQTSNRTVSITVNAPTAPTSASSTSNIAYSTSATAIPLTLGGGTTSSISASALSPAVGTLNIVGTNATYTASSTQYAPTVTFTYQAVGPCASSASSTVTINVAAPPAPVITSSNMASGTGGQAFNYSIVATNVPTMYSSTALPAGLTLNATSGVISGTPTVSGTFPVTVSAMNSSGTGSLPVTITIGLATPVITSTLTANATSGSAFTYTITANNLPASFNATGLPTGLAVNTSTGVISGTPVVAIGGPVNVLISATNATGADTRTLVLTVSLNPPTITSAATASGTSGQAFGYQITASDFPSSFGASGLPAGLTINTGTGLISGTPVVAATTVFNVIVSATNGSGTTSQAVAITITLAPPAITSAATATGTATFPFSYQITASNGPTSFGASGLPAGLSVNPTTGLISGTPTTLGTSSATVTATNASGTGTQAVTITIANQAPPNATPVGIRVPFNTTTTYDLVASITGVYTSITITSQVTKGTLTVNGFVIAYTPNAGYFGPDSFAYTATGPGGTSPPATATLDVGTPGAPTAAAKSVTVTFNTATAIDLSASIGGVATTVSVTVPPQHGSVTVNGKVVTYTPTTGYFGDDSFSYAAVGPGGISMPADVTIKILPLAPSGETVSFILPLNTPTTLDLTPFVKGTAITGVVLVGAPQHGTLTVNGMRVTYTPAKDFFGADTFTYSAFGIAGKSAPATVRVTVVGRPDPARDANVTALLAAQSDTAQRFARAQISNFQSRMESLHRSGDSGVAPAPGTPAPTPAPTKTARTMPPTTTPISTAPPTSRFDPIKPTDGTRDALARTSAFLPTSYAGPVPAGTALPFVNELASLLTTKSLNVASLVAASSGLNAVDGPAGSSSTGIGPLNFWISGVANFGKRVAAGERNQLEFTTDGVSLGVDRRFGNRLAAGVGVGFARDRTDIGVDGSKSRGRSASLAVYSSYHPTQNTFVDGLLGIGKLNFKTQRYVAPIDAFASDDRNGNQLFASLAGGYEYRNKGFLLSPYLRLDYTSDRLNQSTENGAGQYALTYFPQTTPSLQGVAGFRAESLGQTNYGWAIPRARLEYRREFQGERDTSIAYADLTGGTRYAFSTGAVVRNALLVGVGADFIRRGGLTIGLDYQLLHNFSKDSQQGIRLNFTQDLDGLGSPYALRGFFSIPQKPQKIQFDAGFMFDSNAPRAKEQSDKRSDRAYSVNVGKGFVFKMEERENLRALVTYTLGAEKFQNFDGLSRAMAGAEGEVQYRTSASFDAYTFAVFTRASIERYRSSLRDGYRYSVGVSARRSLTDRIDIFAALAHNERVGDSSVFSNRDNSVRFNVDYALSDRETLYATGEYRRGQVFSSGRASLDNLDVSEVFVLDDAFSGTNFFAYRFDATTVISTLGYNLGFGPRHSLDVSWRRAQSKPRLQSGASTASSSYVADQYSIIYLIRF